MVTIILAIALLGTLTGLVIEIGIASWNICRANKHQRKEAVAKHKAKHLADKMESLDKYAVKISWLLNFLYNYYDKFADLEMELREGLKGVTKDTPIGEVMDKYKDLKKALKLIRVTVKASDRMENLMNSIATQLDQIREDFQDDDDEKPEASESGKHSNGKSEEAREPGTPETPAGNALETEKTDDEVPAF